MESLRDTLREAVRKMAFRASVDSLKKRGVKQVNLLGLDRIMRLIDEAVHKGLRHRLIGDEREEVADATKAEFLRLLKSNEDLRKAKSEVEKIKERAEEEVDRLRLELAAQRRALRAKLDESARQQRARYAGEDEATARRVDELFQELARETAESSELDLAQLQSKVVEVVKILVDKERRATAAAKQALHDREVERMQRRISKLVENLDQTESRLREVSSMKNIDEGISSVYREVQGLDQRDSHYGRKRELLTEIFEANLKLQKRGA